MRSLIILLVASIPTIVAVAGPYERLIAREMKAQATVDWAKANARGVVLDGQIIYTAEQVQGIGQKAWVELKQTVPADRIRLTGVKPGVLRPVSTKEREWRVLSSKEITAMLQVRGAKGNVDRMAQVIRQQTSGEFWAARSAVDDLTIGPPVAENGDIRGEDNDGDGIEEYVYVSRYVRSDGVVVRAHYRAYQL